MIFLTNSLRAFACASRSRLATADDVVVVLLDIVEVERQSFEERELNFQISILFNCSNFKLSQFALSVAVQQLNDFFISTFFFSPFKEQPNADQPMWTHEKQN